MHSLTTSMICTLFALGLSSCTIYRSPERHDFENEYSQYKVENQVAALYNLKILSCSNESVASQATASRVLHIDEQILLSEYIVNSSNILESSTSKGDFCIYESTASNN